jgi:predicted aspartyl protease
MRPLTRALFGLAVAVSGVALAQAATVPCQIHEEAALAVSVADNRVRTSGTIDGAPTPLRVLVDTGAPFSFLTRAAAQRLALPRYTYDPQVPVRMFAIGGEAHLEKTAVKRLQIGSLVVHDESIFVVDSASEATPDADFVLAEDLLSRSAVEFDLAHGMIRLLRPEHCEPDQLPYWTSTYSQVELEAPDTPFSQLLVQVTVNGRRMRAVLDTGAPTSAITRDAAQTVGVAPWRQGAAPLGRGSSAKGVPIPTWLGTFASFAIGEEQIRNVSLQIADLFGRDTYVPLGSHLHRQVTGLPSLLIGCDFFLAHRMLVLPGARKLLFTYNGGPVFQVTVAGTGAGPDPRR